MTLRQMRKKRLRISTVPHVHVSVRGPKTNCFECFPCRAKEPVLLLWIYWLFVVIFWMVLVVLIPLTVGTISTRPPQVLTSSAPTMVDVV